MSLSRYSGGDRLSRVGAFTLVELLVVIGIIALLISILLPSLAKARDAAKTVQCMSQMRQIGVFITMYQNDNKGVFPMDTWHWPVMVTWQDRLSKYDGRNLTDAEYDGTVPRSSGKNAKGLYLCPYDVGRDESDEIANNYFYTSYLSNMVSEWQEFSYAKGMYEPWISQSSSDPNYGIFPGRNLSKIVDPSNVIMVAEVTSDAKPWPPVKQGCWDYLSGGINRQTLVNNAEVIRPHGGSGATLKTITASNWGAATAIQIRTRGKYNYLMVDGHVATMDPFGETLKRNMFGNGPELAWVNGMWVDGIDPGAHYGF